MRKQGRTIFFDAHSIKQLRLYVDHCSLEVGWEDWLVGIERCTVGKGSKAKAALLLYTWLDVPEVETIFSTIPDMGKDDD